MPLRSILVLVVLVLTLVVIVVLALVLVVALALPVLMLALAVLAPPPQQQPYMHSWHPDRVRMAVHTALAKAVAVVDVAGVDVAVGSVLMAVALETQLPHVLTHGK